MICVSVLGYFLSISDFQFGLGFDLFYIFGIIKKTISGFLLTQQKDAEPESMCLSCALL
jgi:hypothetical protein